MKTIKIIDSLALDTEGVKARMRNGRLQQVHLRQGDLDGACAVYSTMMILIMIGAVKYSDISVYGNNYDRRYSIERLKKELFELKGLHRDGNYLFHDEADNIQKMLQRSFSKKVTATPYDFDEVRSEDIIDAINENISSDLPVLISIAYKRGGYHALVAVGIEYNSKEQPVKILCLDPGYATPKFTYWNCVIDLKPQKGKYTFRSFTETGDCDLVQLQDILVIEKR